MKILILLLGFVCFAVNATTFEIKYSATEEDNKTGFFDRTQRTPTLENPGETIGEARRYVFEYAVRMIGSQLHSKAPILIGASYGAGNYTASTISNGYYHSPTSNYDEYGILQDDIYYLNIIKRMLQNDPNTSTLGKYYTDSHIQFNYHGTAYDITPVDGEGPTFLNLVLHELVHGMGFTSFDCLGECVPELKSEKSYISKFIFAEGGYNDYWDNLSLTDKDMAARENGTVFFYGSQDLNDYIAETLTNGFNEKGVMLHSEPLSNGGWDNQSLAHISPNVEPAQLMTARVGNTLELGASAYILCDMAWCRNDGFVTDFEMTSKSEEIIDPDTQVYFDYTVSNNKSHQLTNVFVNIDIPTGASINNELLSGDCDIKDTYVLCEIGNLSGFESKQLELPFNAPIGSYRIISNVYSDSHVVDQNGANNVHVKVITSGVEPFPDVNIDPEFTFEEDADVVISPAFEANSALAFDWSIRTDSAISVQFNESSTTGELSFKAPSVDSDSVILLKLTVSFKGQVQEINVDVNITAKSDGDNGTGGTGTGGTGTGTGNQNKGNDASNESSGGSTGALGLLTLFSLLIFRRK